jgi:nicotinamide mononucleotide transporter
MALFDINNIFINILNYNLSYLEFFGVITGIAAVYLASLEKAVNFYIGIINFVLYFIFFYQYRLYSMMLLQAVYFFINIYGIYSWSKRSSGNELIKISPLKNRQRAFLVLLTLAVAAVWAYFVITVSAKFPEHIEKPAYPYIDALITIASIVAQILLTRKKIDNWVIWIVADFASVILYCVMGIYFTAILYACFWLIAVKAFFNWKKIDC